MSGNSGTASGGVKASGIERWVPAVGWLKEYQPGWLRYDVIAGLTIVALLVPEGMAYAQIAGVPPETAFYAAPAGLALYALLGTSRQLVVAVSSAIAILSAATIGPLAAAGSAEYLALTAALAVAAGTISIVAGLLRLGRFSQFFSESVLTGFVFGLALIVALKQVPKMLGVEAGHTEGIFRAIWAIGKHIPDAHGLTVAIALASLAVLIGLERYFKKVPAALAGLLFGIGVVTLLGLDGRGVEIVGNIPAGIASPKLPDIALRDLGVIAAGAMGIALIAFSEAVGPTRTFARKHRYDTDPNKELIAIGAANAGAGLFQGFSIGSSLSKSAASERAGAKTPMALLIAAGLTIVVALFFTGFFHNLPEATLGAIVIVAVSGMMNVSRMRRLWVLSRAEFALGMTALLGVLIFDALTGLFIAVALSMAVVVWRAASASLSVLGRTSDQPEFVDVETHPGAKAVPGLLILRLNEELFFANASSVRDEVLSLASKADPPVRVVVLNFELTGWLDVPGAEMLVELAEDLRVRGITLQIARVHFQTRAMLERTGAIEAIGENNIFRSVLDAVIAFVAGQPEKNLYTSELVSVILDEIESISDDGMVHLDDETLRRIESLGHRFGRRNIEVSGPSEQDDSG